MSKTESYMRIAIILLFALTFTTIGWSAPVLYATYVPQDDVIEVHNYTASDTTVNSESHFVCFDRTVNNGMPADTVTELYLLNEDGDRIEVSRESEETFFQEGRDTVIVSRDLPENIFAGEYRYVVVITLEMANDRVTRDVSYESDKFTVTNGPAKNTSIDITC